jgi:hypothetical protein
MFSPPSSPSSAIVTKSFSEFAVSYRLLKIDKNTTQIPLADSILLLLGIKFFFPPQTFAFKAKAAKNSIQSLLALSPLTAWSA